MKKLILYFFAYFRNLNIEKINFICLNFKQTHTLEHIVQRRQSTSQRISVLKKKSISFLKDEVFTTNFYNLSYWIDR